MVRFTTTLLDLASAQLSVACDIAYFRKRLSTIGDYAVSIGKCRRGSAYGNHLTSFSEATSLSAFVLLSGQNITLNARNHYRFLSPGRVFYRASAMFSNTYEAQTLGRGGFILCRAA